RRPTPRGLDHAREADAFGRLAERGAATEIAERPALDHDPWRDRHAGALQRVLREHLVEGHLAIEGCGPRVGDLEEVEEALDGAVLAFLAVQCKPAQIGPSLAQSLDQLH